jgi:hypothetical protein
MMHALRQHARRCAIVAAGLTLLGAALLCAQLSTAHAQERPQRREKIVRPGETPPDAPAPASQTAAQSATEADCTIRRERRNYCARLVIADTSAPVVRNVTSTVVEVRNVSNDVTITGSNNYVETDNSGYTTQNSNNSIQKASNSTDVAQRGSGTISTVKDSFSANQSADNSYVIADNNVFARQSGFRSHQVARGEDQITEQTGAYSTNIAYASNAIQGGHNTANYFFGTANEDILTLQSNPISNSYTGNRFFARMGGGDDYVRVEGTRITADIDGGDGSKVLQLEGREQDWIVTTNADGSKTYTHEGLGNVVTVRTNFTVIIGDNFPGDPIVVPPAATEGSPLEKMQRLAERLGRPLNLPWRAVQADHLMRQRRAETEPELKERLRRAEAAEQSGSIEQ